MFNLEFNSNNNTFALIVAVMATLFPCTPQCPSRLGRVFPRPSMAIARSGHVFNNGMHSGYVFREPTPSAIACAIPNFGTFRAHKGLKWSVKHILPPRYILAVLPSSSGRAISGAVAGYVTGIFLTWQ